MSNPLCAKNNEVGILPQIYSLAAETWRFTPLRSQNSPQQKSYAYIRNGVFCLGLLSSSPEAAMCVCPASHGRQFTKRMFHPHFMPNQGRGLLYQNKHDVCERARANSREASIIKSSWRTRSSRRCCRVPIPGPQRTAIK